MARTKSKKAKFSRSKQYEFNSLLRQAKETYDASRLVAVTGAYTPSFKDILKTRGINPEATKQSKKSLSMLRKLAKESSLYEAAQATLSKFNKPDSAGYEAYSRISQTNYERRKQVKNENELIKQIKKEQGVTKQEAMNAINVLKGFIRQLEDLRWTFRPDKNGRHPSPSEYSVYRNVTDMIQKITDLLNSNASQKIFEVAKQVEETKPIYKEFYYDGDYEYNLEEIGLDNTSTEDEYFQTNFPEPGEDDMFDMMIDTIEMRD